MVMMTQAQVDAFREVLRTLFEMRPPTGNRKRPSKASGIAKLEERRKKMLDPRFNEAPRLIQRLSWGDDQFLNAAQKLRVDQAALRASYILIFG